LLSTRKDRVRKYRGGLKMMGTKKPGANKRRLAKAKSGRDESAEAASEEDDQVTTGAGAQFGANGIRQKKARKK
jgi:hypothetical protein